MFSSVFSFSGRYMSTLCLSEQENDINLFCYEVIQFRNGDLRFYTFIVSLLSDKTNVFFLVYDIRAAAGLMCTRECSRYFALIT